MNQILEKLNTSALIEYKGESVLVLCEPKSKTHSFSILYGSGPLDFSYTALLLHMALVLILTHLLRLVLKPLRQPCVISDVLAGIILGPSVLGRNKTFAKLLTPQSSKYVIQNIGIMGFMLWLFVTGVKMDLTVVTKAGKKHCAIALAGFLVPHLSAWIVALLLRDYMDVEMRKVSSMGGVISAVIITTFPVIYSILRDMDLLSSELGRIALLTVILSDIVGINVIVTFEAMKQGEYRSVNALYYQLTLIMVFGVVIGGIPFVMRWINRRAAAADKPVEQVFITAILLVVFIMGFITDFIGAAIGNGPLWLGLAIPDGPLIGMTIVQKTETFLNHILIPFSFATIGHKTDVFAMNECWSCLGPTFAMTIMGFFSKIISTVMGARFMDMSYKDSFVLSLMLSLRGQTEFLLYLHWVDLKMISTSSFSMMIILTMIGTSVATPLISILYDPTKPYMSNKKRTLQHTQQETELGILACIYDEESVANLLSLIEVANPTRSSPFRVFALYLVELLGRAAPVFMDHSEQDHYWDPNNEAIHKAVMMYQEAHKQEITMHFFTTVTPQRTMYQDICELALVHNVSFIILPFHKKCLDGADDTPAIIRPGVQSVNANTLSHAPCSVAILACKDAATWTTMSGRGSSRRRGRQFAMVFLGGADAREALSLADRMVGHPDVSLIVIRFLATDYKGEDELEKKMDDGVVTRFWVKNEMNENVVYKEVVVSTGLDTLSAIQSFNETSSIDMWIVGRTYGINPILLRGLSDWSENPELGLIGDFLVSMDFSTTSSVLVVQQQVLRDQRATPWICIDL